MSADLITKLIDKVNQERLKNNLFYLSKDPLPFRKLNYTIPGHEKNTLYEADDYITSELELYEYKIEKEACKVQAFRRDTSKPIQHQYSTPMPEDPWYTAYNLYAKKLGTKYPDRFIIFIAHKDSQSWIDSPGAYDNAVGTVAIMEIARVLSEYDSLCSIWFIFCNEEHTPWTSAVAANKAKERGDNIIAVFNLDGLGGKSQEDTDLNKKTNVTLFSTPEGEKIADLISEVNIKYNLCLIQSKYQRPFPNDDDGSYIKAGIPVAVANTGSFPYMEPNYHIETDTPDIVDIENVWMSTKLSLASAVMLDRMQSS